MAANLGIRSPPPLPSLRSPAQPPRSSPFPRLGRASPTDLGTAAPPFKPLVSRPRCLGGASEIRAGTGCEAEEGEVRSGGETVRTLLIDNYDSYTYNIYQELSVVNGEPPVVVHNDEWTLEQIKNSLYEEKAFDNIVISPGPGSPSCAADIGICLQILLDCADIPILGVCLGHQALGFVHGAKVIHAPEPIHGRLSEIEHTGCSLFRDIPSGRNSGFKVVRYHSLVIDAETLPKELIPIAWTTSVRTLSFLETHRFDSFVNQANKLQSVGHFTGSLEDAGLSDGCNITGMVGRKVIMGVMHSARPHYGVQFHPESIATHYGRKIFENFKRMTVNYGLMSSSHQERKVLYERQSCKEPSKRKTSCNKASRNHELDLWPNPVLTRKSVDDKYIRLQWMKIDCLVSQVGGAENIFHYLFGEKNAENTFWLDSSSTDQGRARFSFMGGKGGPLWKQLTFRLSAESKTSKVGGYLSIQDVHGSVKKRFLKDGLFDFLNKELQSFQYDKEDYEGLPFDFYGGYIGFIGYDLKVECGAPSNTYKSTTPDACFFFADNLVVIDHNNGDVYILCIHDIYHSDTDLGLRDCSKEKSWLVETEKRLMQLKAMWRLKAMSSKKFNMIKFPGGSSVPCKGSFVVEKSRQQYVNDVEKCLKFIRDGESYELCLTTQMRKRVRDLNALRLYLNLRDRNPAPYAAWLNFANENLCICCSSPERFLRLDANGTLEAKPIKGTIARGQTPEEDEHLRLQLQFSEKDQAENLMIVDLLRNDLGRVCKPGSVTVPRLMEVESYATVHTLVSTVQGKRKPEVSPINCVRAAFPGGSMTGAPKLRSMELLDSLEASSRGIYSGSIGFFSYNQTFDLNIVIRTVVIHDGEVSVGAGGAIVAMSNPEAEYEEMMLKAKAPTIAVEECSKDLDHSSQALKMAI